MGWLSFCQAKDNSRILGTVYLGFGQWRFWSGTSPAVSHNEQMFIFIALFSFNLWAQSVAVEWPSHAICKLALREPLMQNILRGTIIERLERLLFERKDMAALRHYQHIGYVSINVGLKNKVQFTEEEAAKIVALKSAKSRLPKFTGICFRGVTEILPYQMGEVFVADQFLSATLDLRRAENFAGKPGGHKLALPPLIFDSTILAIESKSGGYFGGIEREIIFTPGTEFEILERIEIDAHRLFIRMKERELGTSFR